MFCLSLHDLSQTHRSDGSRPPMFGGSRSSRRLLPPQTIPAGSGTGDAVLPFCWKSLAVTRGCKIRTARVYKSRNGRIEQSFSRPYINVQTFYSSCFSEMRDLFSPQPTYVIATSFFTTSLWFLLSFFVYWHIHRTIYPCKICIRNYVNNTTNPAVFRSHRKMLAVETIVFQCTENSTLKSLYFQCL